MIAASHISSSAASSFICLYNWWSSAAFNHLPMPEPIAPLAATVDGLFLFANGLSGQIHALSLPSGNLLRSLHVHHKPITYLTVNDDSSLLISSDDDGLITVLPILHGCSPQGHDSSQSPLHQISAHVLSTTVIVSSAGGYNSTVVASSLDCTCKFWELSQWHPLAHHSISMPNLVCYNGSCRVGVLRQQVQRSGTCGSFEGQ